MTVYGLYVYKSILLIKHNCNDLAIVGDVHEYYTMSRDKLGMQTRRPTFQKNLQQQALSRIITCH